MTEYQNSINQYYGQHDLSSKILAALGNAGKNINALTREDLSSFDEFHGMNSPDNSTKSGASISPTS